MTKEEALTETCRLVSEGRVYDRAEHPELCWSARLNNLKWVGGVHEKTCEPMFGNGRTWKEALRALKDMIEPTKNFRVGVEPADNEHTE